MKKKTHSFAFANLLVLVAIPTVVLGMTVVSAKSEPLGEDYNPKSLQFELFEPRFFRIIQRDNRENIMNEFMRSASPAEDAVVKEEEEEVPTAMSIDGLTETQRNVLRMQLRIGGCPQDVDVGYRLLCESLLRMREHPETREGWKNSSHR